MSKVQSMIKNQNFFNKCAIDLAFVTLLEGLKDFVKDGIKDLHCTLSTKLRGMQDCDKNCTHLFPKLCKTCDAWKTEILNYHQYSYSSRESQIKWKKIDSSKWPISEVEMIKVFAPQWWDGSKDITEDLSATLTLMDNCKKFNVSRKVIKEVADIRNQYAHKNLLNVTKNERDASFQIFFKFLNDNEIKISHAKRKDLLDHIDYLRVNDLDKILKENSHDEKLYKQMFQIFTGTILELNKHLKSNNDLNNSNINIRDGLDMTKANLNDPALTLTDSTRKDLLGKIDNLLQSRLDEILGENFSETRLKYIMVKSLMTLILDVFKVTQDNRDLDNITTQQSKYQQRSYQTFRGGVSLPVKIMVVLLLIYWTFQIVNTPQGFHLEDCKSMAFNHIWKSDVNFQGYLKEHQTFVGRKWLIEDIIQLINKSSRGILLSAEMGFGKSALVSHVLCSNDKAIKLLQTQVLGFHLCRYDVSSTLKTTHFIRMFAGIIFKTIPEFQTEIMKEDFESEYLYGNPEKCSEDPIRCLDVAIIHPLTKIQTNQKLALIIIDALDECAIKSDEKNIVELLEYRINKFPKWIKFLITSRDIDEVTSRFPTLKQLSIERNDERAVKDIQDYIDIFIGSHKNMNLLAKNVNKVMDKNFLVTKLRLESWHQVDMYSVSGPPDPLQQEYSKNLRRAFGRKGERFRDVKYLFELLTTKNKPLSVKEFHEIAKFNNKTGFNDLHQSELQHFIHIDKSHISLRHKSLSDFLTDNQRANSPFYISPENGHKLFSDFYLNESINVSISRVIGIAFHVVKSKEVRLKANFKDLFGSQTEKFMPNAEESIIHTVSREHNSYEIINLIFETFKYLGIDNTNPANVTPAFLASAYGHNNSLRALLDNGASIKFTIKPFDTDLLTLSIDHVSFCKHKSFCGYNLLHIATQHGHFSTSKLLMSLNKSLIDGTNSLGSNAFQLASEQGHVDTMKLFLEMDSSFADQQSLHHAAQSGHYEAVHLLLKYGAIDKCLRCDGSFFWLKNNIRIQGRLINQRNKKKMWKLFDDWWRIQCESALEAAVKKGYFDIISLLLNESQNALHCKEYGGRSPILTAAQYGRYELFEFLKSKGGNITDICDVQQIISFEKQNYMSDLEYSKYIHERCPKNVSIAHLFATHFNHLVVENIEIKWNTTDGEGATAMHYAACNSNSEMLQFFAEKIFSKGLPVSKNGSTPFHSAAICGSYLSIVTLSEIYGGLPDVADIDGKTVSHYALIGLKGRRKNIDEIKTAKHIIMYKWKENRNIFKRDILGRNAIHYAFDYGFFDIIESVLQDVGVYAIDLLNDRDAYGNTPTEAAFKKLPCHIGEKYVFKRAECHFLSTFKSRCQANLNAILSPHEHTIVIILKYLVRHDFILSYDLSKSINLAVNASSLYSILALREFATTQFRTYYKGSEMINTFLKQNSVPHCLSGLHFSHFLKCDENGKLSPMHHIVMNKNNKYWMCSPYHDDRVCLETLFGWSGKDLDGCLDQEGYNLLHSAAAGGHFAAVKYLHEQKGMNLYTTVKGRLESLSLVILNAPYLANKNMFKMKSIEYVTYNRRGKLVNKTTIRNTESQTKDYDLTASYILQHMKHKNVKTLICSSKKASLGLVHIAASKGLLGFLKTAKRLYGKDILMCTNTHRITPGYLANFLNQTAIKQYLDQYDIPLIQPKKYAKVFLFKKIMTNFEALYSSSDIRCLTDRTHESAISVVYKRFRCASKFVHDMINRYNITAYIVTEEARTKFIIFYQQRLNDYIEYGLEEDLKNWCKTENFLVFDDDAIPYQLLHYKAFCKHCKRSIKRWDDAHNPCYHNFMRLMQKMGDSIMWNSYLPYQLSRLLKIIPAYYLTTKNINEKSRIIEQIERYFKLSKEFRPSKFELQLHLKMKFSYMDALKTDEEIFLSESKTLIHELYTGIYLNRTIVNDIGIFLERVFKFQPSDFPLHKRIPNATFHESSYKDNSIY